MGAGHQHEHAAAAAVAPRHRTRLGIALGLVSSIVIAQGIGAWLTGSLALLVDMVHSLADSAGLLIAFVAAILMARPPSRRRTWGFRRIEVVAALGQAILLIAIAVYAVVEGIERWRFPPDVNAPQLLGFGVTGLILNLCAVLVLASARRGNLNMKAAFLEVAMDAMGTLAVIASAILMMTTGYQRADTVAAFVIAALIVPRAAVLIRDTLTILMEFAPRGLDLDEVRRHILTHDHVEDVHDLHASTVATGLPVLSAHVVLDDSCFEDGHAMLILDEVRRCMGEHFDVPITHTTVQLETRRHQQAEPHCAV